MLPTWAWEQHRCMEQLLSQWAALSPSSGVGRERAPTPNLLVMNSTCQWNLLAQTGTATRQKQECSQRGWCKKIRFPILEHFAALFPTFQETAQLGPLSHTYILTAGLTAQAYCAASSCCYHDAYSIQFFFATASVLAPKYYWWDDGGEGCSHMQIWLPSSGRLDPENSFQRKHRSLEEELCRFRTNNRCLKGRQHKLSYIPQLEKWAYNLQRSGKSLKT